MDRTALLLPWLNDAYAMENAVAQLLVNHARRAESYPPLHDRIEDHLQRTRYHAEWIKECIQRHGSRPSTIKTGLASLVGALEAIATDVLSDDLVYNAIADYAAGGYAIATYRALITAADELEDPDTARVCRRILADEEEMADWLERHIPPAALEAFQQDAAE